MNLTIDSWVPVLDRQGTRQLLSLQDLFAQAHELRDLAVKPHEKIALLRLLICITQAALDGPSDSFDWKECRAEIQPKAKAYLEKWKCGFELFGDGQRFLQVPGLKSANEDKKATWTTKMDVTLSSGNNATLFDNESSETRAMQDSSIALSLLAFQNFDPGSPIGAAIWNGSETRTKGDKPATSGKTWAGDSPCLVDGSIHTFLLGESLLKTIQFNLMTKESVSDFFGKDGWGKPVWESFPTGPEWATPRSNSKEGAMLAKSYLGRLVPLPRAALITRDRRFIVMSNGVEYPGLPICREPSTTRITVNENPRLLRAKLDRSLWRELPSILCKETAIKAGIDGPMTLRAFDGSEDANIWVGALVPHEDNSANILDVISSSYRLPSSVGLEDGRAFLESGVQLAESWAKGLRRAVIAYWVVKTTNTGSTHDVWKAFAGSSRADKSAFEKRGTKAVETFWTAVEQHVPLLLKAAENPATVGDWKQTDWGKKVRQAAEDAYEHACPAQTPRQIEAFAIGRGFLFLPKPEAEGGKKPKGSAKAKKASSKTSTPD
jgi:CRISPR system Cascade subunit CasA